MSYRQVSSWGGISRAELERRWGRDAVYLYGRIDSTNDVARELADADAPAGAIVLGREQTEGRGREGKSWHSPPDRGVYVSMIFRPGELENPSLLSVLAGLGIAAELHAAFPGLHPMLKWPNDVLADGRKLGGVLVEAAWSGEVPRHVIAGVGLNVRPPGESMPPEVAAWATSLDTMLGREVPLVNVADAAICGLERRLTRPVGRLDAGLLELLDEYDWLRDRRARVTLPDAGTPLSGVCAGIAPDGALLFRPDRGALRRVSSASVEVER